ncbi:MAG: acyl-CoA thioesterase [Gammaproteobacteria bacterium]
MPLVEFIQDMKVRDYECDMQGIVNNAIYQHYLEHARHEFLQSRGLSFSELTNRGIIIVVVRVELDYHGSLRSGDTFRVSVKVKKESRVRIGFYQQIKRLPDESPVVTAKIITTAIKENRRAYFPEELEPLL